MIETIEILRNNLQWLISEHQSMEVSNSRYHTSGKCREMERKIEMIRQQIEDLENGDA